MDSIEKVPIERITGGVREETEAVVTREFSLKIILNGQEVVTLLCTPTGLDYLAVGFLVSEGLLKSKGEIKKIAVDDRKGVVRVDTGDSEGLSGELLYQRLVTSGGGSIRGASFCSVADAQGQVESKAVIALGEVLALVDKFQHYSPLFQASRGVHSAALCDRKDFLVFSEDIGRHNALDKIFGECLLQDIVTTDRIVITTGRVPSEQLIKVARRSIPIMISLTVPTDLGVRLANELGITLIGSVRGGKMNIYSAGWRVIGG